MNEELTPGEASCPGCSLLTARRSRMPLSTRKTRTRSLTAMRLQCGGVGRGVDAKNGNFLAKVVTGDARTTYARRVDVLQPGDHLVAANQEIQSGHVPSLADAEAQNIFDRNTTAASFSDFINKSGPVPRLPHAEKERTSYSRKDEPHSDSDIEQHIRIACLELGGGHDGANPDSADLRKRWQMSRMTN